MVGMIRRRLSRCRNLQYLKRIHGQMIVNGLNSDLPALRELLVSLTSIHGSLDYAHKLFGQMPEQDLFMWNTMLRGAAHSSNPADAISLFTEMEGSHVRPDSFTFVFVLKACTKLNSAAAGAQFHGMVGKLGLQTDVYVRNALINMHANCGDLGIASDLFDESARKDVVARTAMIAGYARRGQLSVARELFDKTGAKDLVSWNTMITGYAKMGEMKAARELFDQVLEKDIVSWNAMIAGYASVGSHGQAMQVYEEMRRAGMRPDEVTMVSLLSSCADSGALNTGEWIHQSLVKSKCSDSGLSLLLGNALVDMYAKCGSMERAIQVFRGMGEKDLWTWNSIIGGLSLNGLSQEAVQMFREMARVGVKPNDITFLSVLSACSHGGMIEEGRRCFTTMIDEYGIKPEIKHYGCMVDMLGRAGLVKEAFELVSCMETEPNSVVWKSLLAASKVHGNVELGEKASEQLLKISRDGSTAYVLLSNMYSSVGEWHQSENVRRLMDADGVKKEVGYTLFESQMIQSFVEV
ncbi:hypothetical protein J5N97_017327 [Dioscorea zingiberensis]|uniref:Pentatricopeptide repeat-containing protein n=1 Tax=Dioscorea zingiberensis TaxID=325984 RepID=A0A9D5HGG9_9LILI|nr:hypothetical protein J5N97_017327 [Dioscorea zingiberensis]